MARNTKYNGEDVEDGRKNLDEYVDAIGNFTLSDIKGKKKKQIKKTVLQEVKGHKDLIEGATENAVSFNFFFLFM